MACPSHSNSATPFSGHLCVLKPHHAQGWLQLTGESHLSTSLTQIYKVLCFPSPPECRLLLLSSQFMLHCKTVKFQLSQTGKRHLCLSNLTLSHISTHTSHPPQQHTPNFPILSSSSSRRTKCQDTASPERPSSTATGHNQAPHTTNSTAHPGNLLQARLGLGRLPSGPPGGSHT